LEEHNSPDCSDDPLTSLPPDTPGTSDPTPDLDGDLDF